MMWNLIMKSFPQRLMKLIRILKYWGSRTISWLRRLRSLKWSCFKSELNWRGLQVQSLKWSCFKSGLGYDFSSSNITSTCTIVFVPSTNNVEIEKNDIKTDLACENLDKSKSILGAPPKQDKMEAKNPRAKKANSQKPKQKKQHLYHQCWVAGHTLPNCYKWFAT